MVTYDVIVKRVAHPIPRRNSPGEWFTGRFQGCFIVVPSKVEVGLKRWLRKAGRKKKIHIYLDKFIWKCAFTLQWIYSNESELTLSVIRTNDEFLNATGSQKHVENFLNLQMARILCQPEHFAWQFGTIMDLLVFYIRAKWPLWIDPI